MKIAVCYGTRPEAIKLAPVVAELRRRNVEPTIISTGQHTSLLRGTPAESTMAPHVNLSLPSNNDPIVYAGLIERVLVRHWGKTPPPDLVMVQGDTASAYGGALAAHTTGIPIAHVEAGIRTGDLNDPWPEEGFRTTVDGLSKWRFAPTGHALERMYHDPAQHCDFITGNSGIDALYSHTKPTKEVHDGVLITLHRRESFGEPLEHILQGIWAAARRHPAIRFVWPQHPNPRVQEAEAAMGTETPENVYICSPMLAIQFARQLSTARGVITDSGGVQEEAAALGIPCVVARDKTDRPESVELGLARIAGRTAYGIQVGTDWIVGRSQRPDPSDCFGDGKAAPRIVSHLLESQ